MTENGLSSGHLTTPQRKALQALADGATKDQAATLAGRTERTINRWIADDSAFNNALKASTDASVMNASRRLAALLDEAIDTLADILRRDDVADHIQLRSVDVAISNLVKLREHGDLADRVTALEDMF